MTVLALEFSSPQRSVAVVRAGSVAEAIETGGRGTNAFSLIEKVLAESGLVREQIEVIAVGLGPGSYTGIRVALSIAQGWQLARGVKLLGVSSAECLAVQAQAEKIFGRVNVVINAQRNEFYLASYEVSPGSCEQREPLRIFPMIEMQSRARTGDIWIGPEVTQWLRTGKILYPSAATLGRLATGRDNFMSGDQLAPIYLREVNFVKAPPASPMAF